MKFRFLISAVGIAAVGLLTSCSSGNSSVTSSSSTGVLYVATQGNQKVSTYSISLSNGALTAFGTPVIIGTPPPAPPAFPSAIILTPAGDAAFVASNGDDTTIWNDSIWAYKVGSNGTLTSAGNAVNVKLKASNTVPSLCPVIPLPTPHPQTDPTQCPTKPVALATDAGGKFLFVADQMSDTISVFAISSGATLTEVAGSPFSTVTPSYPSPTGPVALATLGNFLYVANQSANAVAAYQFDSSTGALTLPPLSYFVGTAPAGLLTVALPIGSATPQSQYLYITNSGSNNISAFTACAIQSQTCAPTGTPDGKLTQITNSPFSAGTKPGFMASDSTGGFLYTVDTGANQISGFTIAPASGILTAAGTSSINTGANPVWAAIRFGNTTTTSGVSTTTDFIYVANSGASSVSGYSLNTTTGQLTLLANTPLIVGDQPSAVAVK